MRGAKTEMAGEILDYKYERWQGHNEEFFVSLTDATLRRHLNAYLQAQGICAMTYAEMMEQVRHIEEQQYEAFQRFLCVDYWLICEDAEVIVRPLTPAAYKSWKGRK
jgi:hypothetical protein